MMTTDVDHGRAGDETVDEQRDDTGSTPTSERTSSPPAPRRGRRDLVLVLAAALVAAAGLGAWWFADSDNVYARAEARDVVVVEATRAIEVLNTLDYREVEDGIEAWRSVSTGTLADQLGAVGEDELTLLAEQEKISTGTVVDAAVLELGDSTATVLAAVEVSVVDAAGGDDAEPEVKRNRFTADVEKVDGQWRLSSLQQVAVSL